MSRQKWEREGNRREERPLAELDAQQRRQRPTDGRADDPAPGILTRTILIGAEDGGELRASDGPDAT
jgi:hypothetical protein